MVTVQALSWSGSRLIDRRSGNPEINAETGAELELLGFDELLGELGELLLKLEALLLEEDDELPLEPDEEELGPLELLDEGGGPLELDDEGGGPLLELADELLSDEEDELALELPLELEALDDDELELLLTLDELDDEELALLVELDELEDEELTLLLELDA